MPSDWPKLYLYRNYSIEVASHGEYAQVRWFGDFRADFRGPTSYEDAKGWIDAHEGEG